MDKAEAILKKLFGRYVDQDDEGLIGFFSQWQGLVGTDLAAHADPVDIKNGALYLEVDHPAWLQRLHAKQADILKAIQGRFPDLGIEQLYFRMTREPGAGASTGPRPEPRSPAPETKAPAGSPAPRREAAPEPPSENAADALERLPESNLKRSLERLKDHLEDRD
jgi:hypothetical protein